MLRDLRRLADTRFDLVVIGAGLYGAIAAWDATLRGLAVALIDKGDFGSGTSFNNMKTLHGGLRSLQAMNFAQMRLFVRERRALARVAPHLVRPLPFVIPTYRHPKRSVLAMRLALPINDAVSRDRHEGLTDPGLQLPDSELLSRDECLQLNPVIAPDGVTGGAIWHDYQMHNTDRMTFSFVLSAAERGAVTANYVRAMKLIRDGSRLTGISVEDHLGLERFEIQAPAVINAAGPWATSLLQKMAPDALSPAPQLSRAVNLVLNKVVDTHACGGLARGRFLFLAPWRDLSILGTSHDVHRGAPDQLTVTSDDVDTFLAHAQEAFPRANLTPRDVRLIHRGLLPMVDGHGTHVKLLRESAVIDHQRDGYPGLISMFGVRYTTARYTASLAVDAVFQARGTRKPPRCCTADVAVTGGAIDNKESFLRAALLRQSAVLSAELIRRIALTYGTNYEAILHLIREEPRLAAPLGASCSVTGAEIVHAVREESAVKLTDALIRRTEAGSGGHPGRDAIEAAAALMARELCWDESTRLDEIAEAEGFYRLPL